MTHIQISVFDYNSDKSTSWVVAYIGLLLNTILLIISELSVFNSR